jgi:transposase InsO family protein
MLRDVVGRTGRRATSCARLHTLALLEPRRLPRGVGRDNGPEFAGQVLDRWARRRGVALLFIQPGKPVRNTFAESFDGGLRDECLKATWCWTYRSVAQRPREPNPRRVRARAREPEPPPQQPGMMPGAASGGTSVPLAVINHLTVTRSRGDQLRERTR